MGAIPMPEFTNVICPKLDAAGEDPRTFARDGFCNACGNTGHPLHTGLIGASAACPARPLSRQRMVDDLDRALAAFRGGL